MKQVFKKIVVSVLMFVCLFGLAACNKTTDTLVVCVGPNPDTIDPALNSAVDGATLIIHAFSGLVGYQQDEDGALVLVPDVAAALPTPTTLTGGKVQYVFTLKDDLKWSDGTALTAADFEYAWKRAASNTLAADYGYMFDVIDGFGGDDDADGLAPLNVTASADGKTLTVVLNNAVPYFFELCAFPTYMPVKQSIVEAGPETWATDVATYVGNGPFRMIEWTADSKIVYEKNPNYHNAEAISLNKIEFALSDDDTAILANYKNGTFKLVDTVPNDEIASLKEDYPDEFVVAGQLGTYYINFNVNDTTLFGDVVTTEEDKAKVRKALGLFIDRNHIVVNIGQVGQQPANSYVPIGLTEPDGLTEFVENNGPLGDGAGYYKVGVDDYAANCAEAIALLQEVGYTYDTETKKFTDFPTFEYLVNTGTGHIAIASYMQSVYSKYGISMRIGSEEWKTFLNTRKNGDYVVARNGWLGDYNDPISFLDMWLSTSGNNDAQFGVGAHATVAIYGDNHDQTWAESYDVLVQEIKSTSDQTARFALMHEAEDIIMETGAICPLYYYTDLYMISSDIDGFFASPLGYKFFMYCELNA
jgi:oligopeptide transport system substrate-binding protein